MNIFKAYVEPAEPNEQEAPAQAAAGGGPRRAVAARNRAGLRNRLAERQRFRDEAEAASEFLKM